MWLQELTLLNFEPLRSTWPELANMGGYAEHYSHTDPESALVKLRSFAERAVDHIYRKLQLQKAPQSYFLDLLNNASFRQVATDLPLDKFHLLRKLGNRAAHGDGVLVDDALHCVREAWQLARWLHVTFLGGQPSDFADFKVPPAEGIDSKAEIKRKAKALAIENSVKEERLRQALQELAELRAAEAAFQRAQVNVDPPPSDAELSQVSQSAATAAKALRFTEDNTRKWLIDRDLRLAGWSVPEGTGTVFSDDNEHYELLHEYELLLRPIDEANNWPQSLSGILVRTPQRTSTSSHPRTDQRIGGLLPLLRNLKQVRFAGADMREPFTVTLESHPSDQRLDHASLSVGCRQAAVPGAAVNRDVEMLNKGATSRRSRLR